MLKQYASCYYYFAGLAMKEDYPYITYYCPHCNALNRPKQVEGHASDSNSPNMVTSAPDVSGSTVSFPEVVGDSIVSSHIVHPTPANDAAGTETRE